MGYHDGVSQKSRSTQAIVLKRVNTGESDRVVTLLTPDEGKVVCVAKGVRKLSSSNRAYLEPGNLVQAYFIHTKSLPLLTQARLIHDHSQAKTTLAKLRQLSQVLEIADRLFAEQSPEPELFELTLETLYELNQASPRLHTIKTNLSHLIAQLGFWPEESDERISVLDLVAQITEKPMRSWDFLTVR